MTKSTSPGGTEIFSGRLLYKGAEADVVRGEWQGLNAVFKIRRPLAYRLPALDDALRRQRTLHEAEMLNEAKTAGVEAPFLYDVDVRGATLVMEYVEGDRVKDLIGSLSAKETEEVFIQFGADAAKLHSAGIMHGDLTTANVVRRGQRMVFMDFGLSIHTSRLEDQAVDLRLIKETLVGAHPGVAPAALEALYRGYAAGVGSGRARAVLNQLRSVERRGRYARAG